MTQSYRAFQLAASCKKTSIAGYGRCFFLFVKKKGIYSHWV